MANSVSLHRRIACGGALVLVVLLGCGGSHGGGSDDGSIAANYSFNTAHLGCEDSLDITIESGTFPAGSTVTFKNDSASYDGSAAPIEGNKVLDCGFPSDAAVGTYDVILNGQKIGQVQNTCHPA